MYILTSYPIARSVTSSTSSSSIDLLLHENPFGGGYIVGSACSMHEGCGLHYASHSVRVSVRLPHYDSNSTIKRHRKSNLVNIFPMTIGDRLTQRNFQTERSGSHSLDLTKLMKEIRCMHNWRMSSYTNFQVAQIASNDAVWRSGKFVTTVAHCRPIFSVITFKRLKVMVVSCFLVFYFCLAVVLVTKFDGSRANRRRTTR